VLANLNDRLFVGHPLLKEDAIKDEKLSNLIFAAFVSDRRSLSRAAPKGSAQPWREKDPN
jgi:hypothetical protein